MKGQKCEAGGEGETREVRGREGGRGRGGEEERTERRCTQLFKG